MQQTRTLSIVVLCVFALCCAEVIFAANSVTDSDGRVWCVRTKVSPAPVSGEEIYLHDEEETFGEFITIDKAFDATPHVFLTPAGKIGIVWSRENVTTGRMEICSTTYDPDSGLWIQPFIVLTSPQGEVNHIGPRMEISRSGIAHLVYVATELEDGRSVSSLIYRTCEDGAWSEPNPVSLPDEKVEAPELYLGASDQGYPLVLVYMSCPQPDGSVHLVQNSQNQVIKSLQKNSSDPDPWSALKTHRLPINLR